MHANSIVTLTTDFGLRDTYAGIMRGAILTANLRQLGEEVQQRFETTLELTEHLYKHGGGTVKKTDYLRTKVVVAGIRSTVALLQANEKLTKAALVNYLGLDWRSNLTIKDTEIAFTPWQTKLEKVVAEAYHSNSDWQELEIGIEVGSARIKEARSGYLPTVAFTSKISHLDNAYKKGLVTSENRDSWSMMLVLELPLFKGFYTRNAEKEAKARLRRLEHQKVLLREGLALQIKNLLITIKRAAAQVETTRESLAAASENRDLNVRAYRQELVETADVIESQLLESFIKAQHYKALHDHAANQVELTCIVGRKFLEREY